ncbi:carbohydrate kinase family protein [Flavivirga eckloniae]|uniref:Ribokinase n=1 Tax=Flavivirga eckloniae TaxID=1803846 RepID=A0A2K9PU77_9FLAO|nr:PfkB family carbohydrate kinase [Flavivirga eckloniae]AUP80378.1 ribokinase [Flavivirga eckloniae]
MRVLCSGLNVVDVLVSTPLNINQGGKNPCEKILLQGGAPAGNAACAIARLGHDVSFLGYFGNNPLSMVAKEELTKHGVKDDLFVFKEQASPAIAVVQIDDAGERTVLYSTESYIPFSPEDIDENIVKDFDLILVDGYDTEINLHLLRLAHRFGIKSVLDMEVAEKHIMKEMLALCTDAILPLEAAKSISGKENTIEALKDVSEITKAQVVITDGANGAYALQNGELVHQPAFKVKVVDTTGCGDSFHAAYASALLQEFSLTDRMLYASYYASQVAQHYGGRTYLPNKSFMEENCPLFIKDK